MKIDRLPKNNSLEALICLQDAWDQVDSYQKIADTYKIITKVSYIVLLVAGVLMSIIAITATLINKTASVESSNTVSQYIVLTISLVITAVTAYVNFKNPTLRWRQLRGHLYQF